MKRPTKHHVPPRSHGARFTLKKSWEEHRAYHIVFGNAPTLEACIEILRQFWWTPQEASQVADNELSFHRHSRRGKRSNHRHFRKEA